MVKRGAVWLVFAGMAVLLGLSACDTVVSLPGAIRQRVAYAALFRPDEPGCATLCWHGLRVGQTSLEAAERIVRGDPAFTNVRWAHEHVLAWETRTSPRFLLLAYDLTLPSDRQIDVVIAQSLDQPFTVQDALAIWGEPVGMRVQQCSGADASHGEAILFFDGSVRVSVEGLGLFGYRYATNSPEIRLRSSEPVAYIRFYSPSDHLTAPLYLRPWEGFRSWSPDEVSYTNMCGM